MPALAVAIFPPKRGDGHRQPDYPKHFVDVGSLGEDFLFDLRGLHAPERDGDGTTFRWTGRFAAIDLHDAGEEIRIVLAGDRPEGAPPARIAVHIGGKLVVEDLAVGAAPQTIVLENPAQGVAGLLTIESTVFSPRALGLSADDRQLGVKVYRIEY